MLCMKHSKDCGAFVDNLAPTSCPQAVPRLARVQRAFEPFPTPAFETKGLPKSPSLITT